MRVAIVTGLILITGSVLFFQQQKTQTKNHELLPPGAVNDVKSVPKQNASVPQLPPKPQTPDLQAKTDRLKNEIDDLRHEIEQGRYVDRINDPATAPNIKEELRDRLSLMVDKTLELTKVTLQRIDKGHSI